jgi:TolA-binding protein
LAAAAVVAGMLSCAYYNIMWTANKEYNKAADDLGFAEFWDPYEQEKLKADKLKLVNSAANRCGKVLVLYPDSKWADDALLLMGKCFLLDQGYDKALTKFREVSRLYSDGDLAEEAAYLVAYTLIIRGSHEEAVPALQNLAANAEDDLIREKASYLGARVAFENGDCLISIDSYVAYIEEYPDGGRVEQARLALGECLLKLGMYREAIDDLQPLIGEMDEEGVLALLRVGKAYRMLGERAEAVEVFDEVLEGASEDTLKARAGIEQALTHLDEGRYEDAIETFMLADSLGNKTLAGEINYRIGLIYERDLGDFDKAVVHYDESVKKKSPHSRSAAKRSSALKNVKAYREDIAAGAGDLAKTRYLLAETYLYDLGMQDKAIVELMAVCDSFPDSEYAARSMLAIAAHLEDEGDTTSADYYQRILDGFPETPYANVARVALGMAPVDVVTEEPPPARADTAASPRTSGGPGVETTEGLVGPPAPAGRSREPFGPGRAAAPGDTLSGLDSTGVGRPYMPEVETMPGLSDSARARYEKYRRYSRPAPPAGDDGAADDAPPAGDDGAADDAPPAGDDGAADDAPPGDGARPDEGGGGVDARGGGERNPESR